MDAATIAEMNEMRKAMGLKLLPDPNAAPTQNSETSGDEEEEDEPASTIETREAAGFDNFKKLRDAEQAKRDREARNVAIKKARDQAQRFKKLDGDAIADLAETKDLDAKSWLKGLKKRQKKLDQTRQQQEEEEAATIAAAKIAAKKSDDLAGVKVGHDMSAFLDGDEQILTLKDTDILDNEEEGDELEDIQLREREALDEKLNLKKKRPAYDPNALDESGEQRILSQYDEEIDGKKKQGFRLNTNGAMAEIADLLETDAPGERRQVQSLDMPSFDGAPASDYIDVSQIKVKKPKKKKNKSTRSKPIDDDDVLFPAEVEEPAEEAMDIDTPIVPITKKRKTFDDSFVDDDDLQASLAQQRRDKLKKRKRSRPEDLAKQIKATVEDDVTEEPAGLVLDETTEFLSAIKATDDDTQVRRPTKKSKSVEPSTKMEVDGAEDDHEMEDIPAATAENEVEEEREENAMGVDNEKLVSGGIGATLALLKERRLVEESNGAEENDKFRQRKAYLAEMAALDEKYEEDARQQRERDKAYLDRMPTTKREEHARRVNDERGARKAREHQTLLRKYDFNVKLKYTDADGRRLNQKEAFKELSHQFHGKGSGKGKTDKRLSKIDQEKRQLAKSIFDSSNELGISSAAAQQTRKRREAGVRMD